MITIQNKSTLLQNLTIAKIKVMSSLSQQKFIKHLRLIKRAECKIK